MCSVHIQSEVIQLLLAQLTVAGLLFQHLAAQDLDRIHSRALKEHLQLDRLSDIHHSKQVEGAGGCYRHLQAYTFVR